MPRGLLLAVCVLGASACGITSRHTVGPTVDSDGRFGFLFSASLGPVVGCAREIAVPVRAAAGVSTVDNTGGVDDSAVLAFDVGGGVDWLLATPRPSKRYEAKGDPDVGESPPGWRLGKRLGLRTSWLHVGEVDAWALGASATFTVPLPRNLFSLGVEAGCDAFLLSSGGDAPAFRCDLGLAFDVTNLHAVEGSYY